MNTRTCSRSLVLPTDKGKADQKARTRLAAFIRAEKSKFLLALTVWTWIVAIFLSALFYFAVRNNLTAADWLACILLGMVLLGWIMVARYSRAASKPIRPAGQEDPHDQQN